MNTPWTIYDPRLDPDYSPSSGVSGWIDILDALGHTIGSFYMCAEHVNKEHAEAVVAAVNAAHPATEPAAEAAE